MRKAKSISKLKQDAAKALQKLVRVKAAYHAKQGGYVQCVSCKEWKHYKEMDGGHFIERGKLLLEETNIHPQCKGCNGFGMKGTVTVLNYEDYMVDMYGREHVQNLRKMAGQPQKHSKGELEDMIKEWNSLSKELEAQI